MNLMDWETRTTGDMLAEAQKDSLSLDGKPIREMR